MPDNSNGLSVVVHPVTICVKDAYRASRERNIPSWEASCLREHKLFAQSCLKGPLIELELCADRLGREH